MCLKFPSLWSFAQVLLKTHWLWEGLVLNVTLPSSFLIPWWSIQLCMRCGAKARDVHDHAHMNCLGIRTCGYVHVYHSNFATLPPITFWLSYFWLFAKLNGGLYFFCTFWTNVCHSNLLCPMCLIWVPPHSLFVLHVLCGDNYVLSITDCKIIL